MKYFLWRNNGIETALGLSKPGRAGFEVSHPSRQKKNAGRVGHPAAGRTRGLRSRRPAGARSIGGLLSQGYRPPTADFTPGYYRWLPPGAETGTPELRR